MSRIAAESDSQSRSISLSISCFLLVFYSAYAILVFGMVNSWIRCNQPQSSRCNSIFFDYICTVIVIVDAILFRLNIRNFALLSNFSTVFDLAIGCLLSVSPLFFRFFSVFFFKFIPCHIVQCARYFRFRVTNPFNCM